MTLSKPKLVIVGNGMGEPEEKNVQWTFFPANARPWMAGPGRGAMEGSIP